MTKNEQVMYIGPTLRGVAKSGAVFSGGIPKKLEKLAAKKPIIKSLIVPISGIVRRKRMLTQKEPWQQSPMTGFRHFLKQRLENLRKENKACLIISMVYGHGEFRRSYPFRSNRTGVFSA